MLAAGSLPCALVVLITGVDTEATERVVVGSVVVLERVGAGQLVPVTGPAVDPWTEGPCVDMVSAWGLLGGMGLSMESPGMC